MYAYSRWREDPKTETLVACALATAAAVLSKFTGLLLVPILALLVAVDLIRAWRRDPKLTAKENVRRGLGWAPTFTLVVLAAINAAYLFRGSFRTAASYQWESTAFRAHANWPNEGWQSWKRRSREVRSSERPVRCASASSCTPKRRGSTQA